MSDIRAVISQIVFEYGPPKWVEDLAGPAESVAWVLLVVSIAAFVLALAMYFQQWRGGHSAKSHLGALIGIGAMVLAVLGLLLPWYGGDILGLGLRCEKNAFFKGQPLGLVVVPLLLLSILPHLSCAFPGRLQRALFRNWRDAGLVVAMLGVGLCGLAILILVHLRRQGYELVGIGIGPYLLVVSGLGSVTAGWLFATGAPKTGEPPPPSPDLPPLEREEQAELENIQGDEGTRTAPLRDNGLNKTEQPTTSETDPVWYLPDDSGEPSGLHTAVEVFSQCKHGRITEATLCWREGMLDWQPLAQVEPFASAIRRLKEDPAVIRFRCPKGHEIVIAKRFGGRLVRCTLCRRTVRVPRAAQDTGASEPADSSQPPARRATGAIGVVVTLIGLAAIAGVSIYLVSRPSPEEKAAKELVHAVEQAARQMERDLIALSRSVDPTPLVVPQTRPRHRPNPKPPVPKKQKALSDREKGREQKSSRKQLEPTDKPPRKQERSWKRQLEAARKDKWFVLTAPRLPSGDVTALALDGEDLWIGCQNMRKRKTVREQDPGTGRVRARQYYPRWVSRYNTRTGRIKIWGYEDGIVASAVDIKVTPEDVWVLSGGGPCIVQRFRKKTEVWLTYDPSDQGLLLSWANALWPTENGLWATFKHTFQNDVGVARLDPESGQWMPLPQSSGALPHPSGWGLVGGPDGLFLISTSMWAGNICKLSEKADRWEVFEPLAKQRPLGTLAYHNGCLVWQDVNDRGLRVYDLRTNALNQYDLSKATARVHAFDGRFIWLALKGDEPLGRLDTRNGYLTRFKRGHSSMIHWGVSDVEVGRDYVWIATNTQGVVRMKPTEYPAIQSTSPPNGTDDVLSEIEMTVTFSHAMRPEQFARESMSLWVGAARVQSTVSYDREEHTAVLTPAGPLDPGATYEVRIPAGLRDIYDEPLIEEYSFSFSIRGGGGE